MTTNPKQTWLVDAEGRKAQVLAADVDTWKPHGWAEADEPEATDMVWLQHSETGGKALFAQPVVDTWKALGWEPAAPPEPVDLTKDQNLVDPQVHAPAAEAPKKAASGSKKEQ